MVKALFDTSILVDYLRGLPQARAELDRFFDPAISIVTRMEALLGPPEGRAPVTRDGRAFPTDDPGVRIPYRV